MDAPWTYPGGVSDDKKSRRLRALAAWARERILELGPTFIKVSTELGLVFTFEPGHQTADSCSGDWKMETIPMP